ncbi:TetR/AcrR family transcriptional regulator [Nocardioides sp. Bht2]|uniref:TetR/AcrR family transcriptional regulator n=1 Tax=Nocardioides sp. Bht2 TaxID=3392297 RepID=UPI0039B40F76
MRTPQQNRSTTSTDRMVQVTLDLLADGGLSAVTIAAVAEAAQSSNGSLYHRFGDRHGLLLAAQARAYEQITAETTSAFDAAEAAIASAKSPADVASQLARAAFDTFTRHRGASRAFLIESRDDADHAAATERFLHALAELVTDWLRRNLGATPTGAQAAWRLLFALGVSQALLDDTQVSAHPLAADQLATTTGRAILAVLAE